MRVILFTALLAILAYLASAKLTNEEFDDMMSILNSMDDDFATTCKVSTSSGLNLRSGPSTSNSIITTLSNGATVTKNSESNGWSYVSANGRTGYVSSQYLSCSGSSSGTGSSGNFGGSNGRSGNQGCDRSKTKYVETLEQAFAHEGKCQVSFNFPNN